MSLYPPMNAKTAGRLPYLASWASFVVGLAGALGTGLSVPRALV